mmetsp:Transcript_9795/g.14856  ORF Transcript_9795/g.14856 Transcript_9795/m.14856 type:complete len:234 (+) Transcript_9795:409-1110(+)
MVFLVILTTEFVFKLITDSLQVLLRHPLSLNILEEVLLFFEEAFYELLELFGWAEDHRLLLPVLQLVPDLLSFALASLGHRVRSEVGSPGFGSAVGTLQSAFFRIKVLRAPPNDFRHLPMAEAVSVVHIGRPTHVMLVGQRASFIAGGQSIQWVVLAWARSPLVPGLLCFRGGFSMVSDAVLFNELLISRLVPDLIDGSIPHQVVFRIDLRHGSLVRGFIPDLLFRLVLLARC